MKIKILDALTLGEDLDLSPFSELGEVTTYPKTLSDEVKDRILDADVVVINKVKLFYDNLVDAKNLKLICIAATGYDNVNLEDAKKLGIAVCNVVGYSTDSVAQTTVALALGVLMRIPYFNEYVKSGEYEKSGVQNCLAPAFCELNGKTWGIVGYGNIGKKTGEIAKAFGCRVLAYSKSEKEGVENATLERLLKESDIVSIHLPLSDATRGIIGKNELSLMKKSAILVNVARGAVTDEDAVAKAIEEREIAGFGCDVYSVEPMQKDNPIMRILNYDNVVLTPHLAWGAIEARERCRDEMIDNIKEFLKGKNKNRLV